MVSVLSETPAATCTGAWAFVARLVAGPEELLKGLLEQVEEGFAAVDLPAEVKVPALEYLKLWLSDERFEVYSPAIRSLVDRGKYRLLVDSFYRMLPFGTGGRRGAVGFGPNRMNPYTVTTSVQGHCEFLARRNPGKDLTVVLACDVRVFNDLRGLYEPGTLGELKGLSSKQLSVMSAEVYAANGVKVHMADPEEETFVSTPELSFLIFNLGAYGGLNISASHNPPDDNGAKFYNGAGGQEVPPYDEELVSIASSVREAVSMPFQEAVDRGLVRFLTSEQRMAYVDLNVSLSTDSTAREARVAFSPLHGTGITTVVPVLEKAGFEVTVSALQSTFDGAFPSVPYGTANPELPSAMEEVIRTARLHGCDIAMATDPDADRIGIAVPDRAGQWQCMTGNQIGVLMAHHILTVRRGSGLLRSSNFVIKTEVTTELVARLAEAFGVRCIGHLLVGFKYIGDVLDHIERCGRWRDFHARPTDFLMAMEESHGVLASELIRDKDAANGALILAEAASLCKREGMTLHDRLMGIYKEFGYYGTGLKSVIMEGAPGLADIRAIQASLRTSPPRRIGGRKVLKFHDRQDEKGVFGPIKSQTDRDSRDVLVFVLEGGSRLVLRPSGTEPKNKTYVEIPTRPLGADASDDALAARIAAVDLEIRQLLGDWEVEMMARIGVQYPPYATHFADSLPLTKKVLFVARVEPELREMVVNRAAPGLAAERLIKLLQDIGPIELLRPGLERMALEWSSLERNYWEKVMGRIV